MEDKFTVLGVDFSVATARELFKRTMEYMQSETLSTVEAVTREMLIQGQEDEKWQESMRQMDMLIPMDCDIFDAVGITEAAMARDVQNRLYLRLLLRYLDRKKGRIFLLADSEEEMECFQKEVRQYGGGLSICGQAVLPPGGGREENVVNEINAALPTCIFSILSCPWQERFIVNFKALVNSRLWFGCRACFELGAATGESGGRLHQFLTKKLFRYLVGREKENES